MNLVILPDNAEQNGNSTNDGHFKHEVKSYLLSHCPIPQVSFNE